MDLFKGSTVVILDDRTPTVVGMITEIEDIAKDGRTILLRGNCKYGACNYIVKDKEQVRRANSIEIISFIEGRRHISEIG